LNFFLLDAVFGRLHFECRPLFLLGAFELTLELNLLSYRWQWLIKKQGWRWLLPRVLGDGEDLVLFI
jgi:hypothetical protein